ncbi:hypothetical protein [Brachybacterium aquaticum]|uniref:DUF4233 domain-containing protein n=1 Tax=Brachybacterium aquaticum TaxID=1432564 RepID=A0A841A7Y8_9MICO|nr:hypothetical protein [Brachybacterium aquaticum]MBB5830956.1 hypothetical protein [Brachybacterium aquaticum]
MPSTPRDSSSDDAQDPSPRTRPLAAALLGVEGLLIAAAATYCFITAASGALDGRLGTGLGIFLLVFAVGAVLAARSLLVKGRFGLGYGITWQFFQALVGASMLRGAMYWQGALALGLAIWIFVLLTRLVSSTPLPTRRG